jgi:hypothetical protein
VVVAVLLGRTVMRTVTVTVMMSLPQLQLAAHGTFFIALTVPLDAGAVAVLQLMCRLVVAVSHLQTVMVTTMLTQHKPALAPRNDPAPTAAVVAVAVL